MHTKPHFLVTGGLGFIGSALVDRLERDYPSVGILIIDNLTHSSSTKGDEFTNRVFARSLSHNVFCDFSDYLLESYNVQCVFHLAALSNTSTESMADLFEQNVKATELLVKSAVKNNIPMVYASSASVYGNEKVPMEEDQDLFPISNYGISKMLSDLTVDKYMDVGNSIAGLRIFNCYGPGEDHKQYTNSCSPMLTFYNSLSSGSGVSLFNDSKQYFRDFIYIDDVVEAIVCSYRQGLDGIFNVGSGECHSFYDIAKLIAEELGIMNIDDLITWKSMSDEMYNRYQAHTLSCNENSPFNFLYKDVRTGVKKYIEYLKSRNNGQKAY